MGWPYQFLDLSEEQKHARRAVLDRYGVYAQLSTLVPTALVLLYTLALRARTSLAGDRRGSYDVIPGSPSAKAKRRTTYGAWLALVRRFGWWLGGDVRLFGRVYGQRDQWVFGSAWAAWLFLLCVLETGRDYMHLTKRFGIVPIAQLPVLYLMSFKQANPFAYVFRSSHEQVIRIHRAYGRVILVFVFLHAVFYVNYFTRMGILGDKLRAPHIFAGALAAVAMSLLAGTALQTIRRLSYRIFFITHVLVAFAIVPLVYYHAHTARLYVGETLIVFVADIVCRKVDTITTRATIEPVPETSLVKVTAAIPHERISKFRAYPGSHVYLIVPAAARPSSNPVSFSYLVFELLANPFTIAAVDDHTGELSLVARSMRGPVTAALARLAHGKDVGGAAADDDGGGVATSRGLAGVRLGIEGPYGATKYFPNLAGREFSRILLVAGGVGATFTVPLYRSILRDNPGAKVEMVWAVRSAADAAWAAAGTGAGKGLLDADNVHLFLTGDMADSVTGTPGDDQVEMRPLYHDDAEGQFASGHSRTRPDLKRIVDDAFRGGYDGRVAVIACGPEGMTRELRKHVGDWVAKGRSVFYHSEAFGM